MLPAVYPTFYRCIDTGAQVIPIAVPDQQHRVFETIDGGDWPGEQCDNVEDPIIGRNPMAVTATIINARRPNTVASQTEA